MQSTMLKPARGRRSYGFVYAAVGFIAASCIFAIFRSTSSVCTGIRRVAFVPEADDAKWLGPQKGDAPPQRLDNYKYETTKYQVDTCFFFASALP